MTETDLKQKNINPPFWAFAWPGGQAIARYILDNPSLVKNKSVLDLASGSGIAGIAALTASARHVDFNDIDPFACQSIHLNCAANGLKVYPSILRKNFIAGPTNECSQKNSWEIIVAGDVFYEQPMSQKIFEWLLNRAREGTEVLIGDPGRCYFPEGPIEMLYQYSVKTSKMIEKEDEIVSRGLSASAPWWLKICPEKKLLARDCSCIN